MKELVDVEITPVRPTQVTAIELLEDFADAAPSWCFLEEDSRRYSLVRGRPGCVVRALGDAENETVEFVFVSMSDSAASEMHIALIVPSDADKPLAGHQRENWLKRFVHAFLQYVQPRRDLVRLSQIEAIADVPVHA